MNATPLVTLAVPAFNEERHVRATLESALAQTLGDLEVLVVDNASTDGTGDVCRELAAADPRVRYVRNETNLGLLANFRRGFELARGRFLRWLGCHDALHPEYLQRCVPALQADERVVAVTCYQEHLDRDGRRHYVEYTGPRVEGGDPVVRLSRMLSLLRGSALLVDPIYSLLRRAALERSALFAPIVGADRVLAVELALIGPFAHVPHCLSRRQRTGPWTPAGLLPRLVPGRTDARFHVERMLAAMAGRVRRQPLSRAQALQCHALLAEHWMLVRGRHARRGARRLLGRLAPPRPAARAPAEAAAGGAVARADGGREGAGE